MTPESTTLVGALVMIYIVTYLENQVRPNVNTNTSAISAIFSTISPNKVQMFRQYISLVSELPMNHSIFNRAKQRVNSKMNNWYS